MSLLLPPKVQDFENEKVEFSTYTKLYFQLSNILYEERGNETIKFDEKDKKELFELTNACLSDLRLNYTAYLSNFILKSRPQLFDKMVRRISLSRHPIYLDEVVEVYSEEETIKFLNTFTGGIEWLNYSLEEEFSKDDLQNLLNGVVNFQLYFLTDNHN